MSDVGGLLVWEATGSPGAPVCVGSPVSDEGLGVNVYVDNGVIRGVQVWSYGPDFESELVTMAGQFPLDAAAELLAIDPEDTWVDAADLGEEYELMRQISDQLAEIFGDDFDAED